MNLSKTLEKVAKSMGLGFTFKGRSISFSEAFAAEGLLPGFVGRAEQLAQLCLGYGMGFSFEDMEQSPLGRSVHFDEFTPNALRLLMILDVLHELARSSSNTYAIPLDEFLYD